MKTFLTILFSVSSIVLFGQEQPQDSLPEKEQMPNAIPRINLLKDKPYKSTGKSIYELPGGMACVVPDSTFRSKMPIVRKENE